MIQKQNAAYYESTAYDTDLNFDELENAIDSDLDDALSDVQFLKEERKKIGNPEALSETVMNVVWEQFVYQIGDVAGEDFIKENCGKKLDLRDSAHIQTTDNFEKGKIASHNKYIDYQERYNDWDAKFQKNDDGSIKTRHGQYTDKQVKLLNKGARDYIDNGRPAGSASVHKDHTISAAEIIRDPRAAAHLSQEEHAAFANSDVNLVDLDASANESKRDAKMDDWLSNHVRDGKTPAERFNIDEQELRQRDRNARKEYEKVIGQGEQRSVETGKKSQRVEATNMGKKALQGFAMGLLAGLIKTIFKKFAAWLKSKQKSLSSFIDSVKTAISQFITDLKEHLKVAAKSTIATLTTMIFGPIVRVLQKAWTFIKQGYKSLKKAIKYLKDPSNKNKPFSIKMMEVGKIIIAGLSAAGSIVLGGAIEAALSAIPLFAIEIPLLGSLASIVGLFFGGLISGVIGAIAINLIDRWIAKKQANIVTCQLIEKNNQVLNLQAKKIKISDAQLQKKKYQTAMEIVKNHQATAAAMKKNAATIEDDLNDIFNNSVSDIDLTNANSDALRKAIADLSADIDAL